jgi:hypothetical protein
MKLSRLEYDPGSALTFYDESLTALGGLCERTWHDRLQVVAEGPSATLWNDTGALHSQELYFANADAASGRDPLREVFPGCPLTFRLTELLRSSALVLEKVVLRDSAHDKLPERSALEKLWRSQYPATRQWRLTADAKASFHFSLVALVRCDIQAIDQHWSLHRIALALPNGEADEALAQQLLVLDLHSSDPATITWPSINPRDCWPMLTKAIETDLAPDIEAVRARQTQYLDREIRRIDDYFSEYEKELARRVSRRAGRGDLKADQRLAAARAEHARRRVDQVARHEIRVVPHVDALLLIAEPAWQAIIETEEQRSVQAIAATFVPRPRKWFRHRAPF